MTQQVVFRPRVIRMHTLSSNVKADIMRIKRILLAAGYAADGQTALAAWGEASEDASAGWLMAHLYSDSDIIDMVKPYLLCVEGKAYPIAPGRT